MGLFIFLCGFFGFFIFLILYIIAAIRKRPKKKLGIATIICVLLFILGASLYADSVPIDEYNAILEERDALKDDFAELQRKYDDLQVEYKELQEGAGAFLKLSEDEQAAELARAEREKIEAEEAARVAKEEAERIAAEKAAQEEKERQEEEAARLAEEAKGYETGITFEEISRSPDDYEGEKVKFTGYVLQINEGRNENEIRMATSGMFDDIIYGTYDPSILEVRVLEDDNITIYGTVSGLKTYTAVLGNSVTLPNISIDRIEINE